MKLFYFLLLSTFLINCNNSKENDTSSRYQKQFDEARLVFHRAYFEKSSILFDALLKENIEHSLPYAYAGVIDLMLFRDPSQNQKIADSLSQHDASNRLFTQALLRFIDGDFDECELILKRYLSENPIDAFAQHVLGFTQIDADRPGDGVKTLNRLLKDAPEYFPAYNHVGYGYLKLNDIEKALEAFEYFVTIDSLNPSAHDSFSEGLYEAGRHEEAIMHLKKAIYLDPNFAYGWKHLGDIYLEIDKKDLALDAYKNALSFSKLYGSDFNDSINETIKGVK